MIGLPTRVHLPFLILETGTPLEALRRHGDFAHWIRVAAGLRRDDASVCRVATGDHLPSVQGWSGVIVTGSASMVTERLDWSERSADWLRAVAQHDLPVLGICYGHQLLAHAFGGQVADNPAGREMGTVRVHRLAAGATDPLLRDTGDAFAAQTTHRQSVLAPPPGADVLARSELDGCQAFRLGTRTWGLQFHPEFSVAAMRGYVRGRAETLAREGLDAGAIERAVRATPQARRLLSRFVSIARHGC